MKLKLVFSYDGSKFQGSATQPHQNSVQDELAKALRHLGIYEKPLFASRTDKGVHALNAVATVNCGEHFKDLNALKALINRFSRPYIDIKFIKSVSDDFQPRFDAKMREYRYLLYHGAFNPFLSSYFHFYPKIDIKKANEILSLFVGTHDFRFFAKQNSPSKDTKRSIFIAKAYSHKNLTVFKFRANGFLRSQIRLMMSGILAVIEGRLSKAQLKEQINAKASHIRTPTPPNALYLARIFY